MRNFHTGGQRMAKLTKEMLDSWEMQPFYGNELTWNIYVASEERGKELLRLARLGLSASHKRLDMLCCFAVAGMVFAALFGIAVDGVFQDAFNAVKDCARSLR